MTVHIDLDQPATPPPARPVRRRGLLIAAAAGVAVAVTGAIWLRPEDPPEKPTPLEPALTWKAQLPVELGEAIAARVHGPTVLIIATNGLIAFDRVNGKERWRQELGAELAAAGTGGLDRENSAFPVRLAGNALVIPRFRDESAPGSLSGYEVTGLHEGESRFTVETGRAENSSHTDFRATGTSLIVVTWDEGLSTITSHSLVDGTQEWRRVVDALVWLPAPTSARRQPVAVRNNAPVLVDPSDEGFIVLTSSADGTVRGQVKVEVLRLDGTDGGSWIVAVDAGEEPHYEILGEFLLDLRTPHTLRGINVADGTERWSHATLADFGTGAGPMARFSEDGPADPRAFADGLLLDSPTPDNNTSPGSYQLIDLRNGAVAPTSALGGRRTLAVGLELAVGIDMERAELLGVANPSGHTVWTVPLRPEGWTEDGVQATAFLVGDGRLVLGATLGFGEGNTARFLWFVDMATGAFGTVPEVELAGWEDGAVVSIESADGRTVAVRELGAG